MGDEDEHELVDNPQRTWLQAVLTEIDPALESLKSCLSDGETALGAGAWTGPEGSAWEQEFAGRVKQLRAKSQRIHDDVSDEMTGKPLQVCRCQIGVSSFSYTPYFSLPGSVSAIYPSVAPSCSE